MPIFMKLFIVLFLYKDNKTKRTCSFFAELAGDTDIEMLLHCCKIS